MTQRSDLSGPQFRADRPIEQEAVRTTIVGGRPPHSGQPLGAIPRGLEVLIKKAAVDPEFRQKLLARRAVVATEIGLTLDPAEAMMLAAAPAEQIEAIIARTTVPQEHRRAFLGQAAAAMLAALGIVTAAGCPAKAPGGARPDRPVEKGSRPDHLPPGGARPDMPPTKPPGAPPPEPAAMGGERADVPPPKTAEDPPPPPPPTRGIRPDIPPPKA